jgi:hypothetical protein
LVDSRKGLCVSLEEIDETAQRGRARGKGFQSVVEPSERG